MAKIVGTSRVLKKIRGISRQTDLEVRSAIQRNAQNLLDLAVRSAPVDTGSLRDSGNLDTKTNPYLGRVYFGGLLAPYAPYVEFGTGSGFATDPSFVQYASQFIKGPGRNADPQPFLIPAFVFHKKIFLNDIRKIAKKISK
jgi:HK97 gp10 family phage protein